MFLLFSFGCSPFYPSSLKYGVMKRRGIWPVVYPCISDPRIWIWRAGPERGHDGVTSLSHRGVFSSVVEARVRWYHDIPFLTCTSWCPSTHSLLELIRPHSRPYSQPFERTPCRAWPGADGRTLCRLDETRARLSTDTDRRI